MVALGATVACGLLVAAISAFGWLGTKLTLPAVAAITVVVGVGAALLANRSPQR